MDKPDERARQLDMFLDREQRREPLEKHEPLVPEKSFDYKYKRNPDIVAAGQKIVQVLASEPKLMDSVAWLDMRLTEKRELYKDICGRIAEQTGETPLRGDIGDIGKQSSYLIPGVEETFAKISTEKCRHADDFAYEIARLHVFDLQEKKFKRDEQYAASPEGIEVERNLSISGNLGNVRNYLLSTQTAMIAGDASRAILSGKLIKAPGPVKRAEDKIQQSEFSPSQSTESLRLETVNILFSDSRITNKKKWESMKDKPSEKRQLFSDLNELLAEKQKRDPLPAFFGNRKTALYGNGDNRVALINYKEIKHRRDFLVAVGKLNLRQVQELNFENPERYTGLITNAKIKNRLGEEHDMGLGNYREIQWNSLSRDEKVKNRILPNTAETILLGRDILSAYGQLKSIEQERHHKQLRDLEAQRRKVQTDTGET